jgi:predicted  nucleic acid-binding Zn-ribbon protein
VEPSSRIPSEEHLLKADASAQLRLLDLQAVDASLDQLTHRLATLPETLTLATLTEQYDDLATRQGRLQTEVDDLAREQRKADADVEQVKSRRVRNQERIDAGQVGDPKQLQALQHEIETLGRRINDLEDVEIDVMERLEAAQKELAGCMAELDTLRVEIDETTVARDGAASDISARRSVAEAERTTLADELPEQLRTLYERLRAQLGGVGAGRIQRGRCGGCQLDIGAADLARMAAAPDDEVLRCEECNRILVRTADSGL